MAGGVEVLLNTIDTAPNAAVQRVVFLLRVLETGYHNRSIHGIHGISQFLQERTRVVPETGPRHAFLHNFPTHYSLFILQSSARN
jgi:hypothetical protein